MTSKNNDNFDPLDNLKTLLTNTTDNNESEPVKIKKQQVTL